jgi:signal transduction histidine kinase
METVTILWSSWAAVAMTLALVCGVVWLIERRDLASLMLCILGIATAGAAYIELGLMHSAAVEEYVGWLRWYSAPIVLALVSQLLFVHYYLGTGRLWLMWTVIFARLIVALANFVVYPNFNFSSISSLRHVLLFGDQVSTIAVAVASPRQLFAVASLLLWAAYLIDAAVQRWLKGGKESRRKALAVSLGIIAPMMVTTLYTQLLVFGVAQAPVSNTPWFLAALVMMAFELGRDFILSRRERVELAELRNQLAQAERVSLLGQLASALSHELSQPLTATITNVDAAEAHLKRGKSNLDVLQPILDDIRNDHRRAAEILSRMRQLFKKRTIEMQPIGLEDVLHDVVTLVQSETVSKHVALRLVMQPGLPQVLGDRVHLTQVLLNLLMNSVQAMQSLPRDARHIVVEACADDAKREVVISVRDSGPGISADIVDQLFKPFFTTKAEGTGIGLALSRTIIEAHGGRLWCDNIAEPGGAIFRFTLRQAPGSEYSIDKALSPVLNQGGPPREAPA